MTVLRADTLGVCMGVSRALELVEKTLREDPKVPIYTLGPLIHNGRVVEEFRARGVVPIGDVSQAREGIVIIRAHGIMPSQRQEIEARGLRIVDATCPHVKRVQEKVRRYAAKGRHAVIVGDAGHGEVKGIRGYADGSSVVSSVEEAEKVDLPPGCIVVSQTTFKRIEYRRICGVLKRRFPDIGVFDTSCASTETRQESLIALAEKVDAILVIGGRQSANTRWLYQTALQTGKPAWQIEGASEIPPGISRYATVGLSAGASTPDVVIEEVERRLLVFGPR
jgi:4-hydroxy-3-methylbut-2-enyl diphosphate reductase